MENFSKSRSPAQRYMPKRNLPTNEIILLVLTDAFLSSRPETSGFHAIHIAAVQATRAIYLEKWVSMSEIGMMATTMGSG
jgi:hypothetical protein